MENLKKVVEVQNGEAFVLSASGEIVQVADKHALTEDEILLLDKNTQAVFVDDFGSESLSLSDNCISCVAITNDQIIEQQLPENAELNLSELLEGNVSVDEIAAIQNAILSGDDPTQTQEAPAAGVVSEGSAIGRFITIDYDNDSMLTEAGFDTSYNPSSQQNSDDSPPMLIAEGGEQISLQVTEGDLSEHSYPVSTSQTVTVAAGSLPLDPSSFTFTSSSLPSLLNELSSEISSGGQPVLFIFDPNSNSIVGTQNGEIILTIEIKGADSDGNNADIEIVTTIHGPIDHNSNDSNGVVTSSGDQIQIDFDLTGTDTSGNEIDEPINVDVTIVDGQNPSFGLDSGISLNEETDNGKTIIGQIEVDTGSDAVATIEFNPNQPNLAGLTSHGEPVSVVVDGNILTLVDSDGNSLLEVTINIDGSYSATITGSLDQDIDNVLDLPMNITITDQDGDSAQSNITISISDGSNATGGEDIALTITEGDLDTNGAATGNPTTYPVSQSGSFVIAAGEDRLVPDSVQVDPAQTAALLQELSAELTSGGQELTFTLDSNGNIIGTLPDGTVAITVSLSAVQDGQDVKVTVDIEQNVPLDHTNSGDSDGFVHSQGDNIEISVPVQAQDTDGDSLENSANVDITIVDGQNPSFGLDSGVIINETDDKTQVIHGQIPLDVGSDSIASIVFEPEQPTLDGLTSNGEPTTVDISGNTITVFDNHGEPVLTVTIATDGSYEVAVTGPLDQGEGDSIDLDLSVTATDSDGDNTSGNAIISITDGQDAAGGEDIALTITEGDLDTNGAATGNPSSYPVSQSGSFVIAAGEDRLVPDSVQVDPAQTAALLQELSAELTSGGQALTFTLDSNGNIIGTLPDGTVAITVSLSAVQDGQDVKVTVDIEQNVPLDHTNSGDSDGFVHSQGDNIEISVPVQAQDTDGDSLENSANVDITIVDGQNPSFGLDSGVIINETDDKTQVIHGQIPLDVGSDSIASIVFEPEQPTLDGLTSNGEPTTVDISGNTITVFDNHGEPVLTVTIATDGSYEVTVTGPLDQGEGDSIDLDLSVTATDSDGDSTSGNAIISITDGQDATGGEDIALTITEGDLDTNGAATGNPTTYPVSQSGSFVIAAGEDRLVPDSVQVDPAQTAALLQELSAELTSGGQALTFTLDSNGNIIGTLPDGTVAITVSLSAVQDGQDVKVTVDIEQNVPLDHTNSGDSDGFVHSQGDNIEISVPVQAQDTDGDSLENSANVDITIVDGQNPSFGLDSGVIINETDDKTQVIHGQIPLDVGSDSIASIVFDPEQPTLDGLTSNGEPTTVDISGNTITVFDNHGEPVLTVTIAADGSYEVTVTGPLDQGEGDSIDLDLSVTATDSDGDSTSGNAIISITDGQDATGGEDIALTITEGDLDTNGAATGNPSSYPVSQSGSFVIAAGEDRLVPDSVQVDPAQTAALLQELSAELTSGGQALTFTLDSNGNIIGTLPDGTVAITVSLSAVQDGQDVKVTVDIEQNVPLDHTNSGDSDGFVHSQGDNIEISVPVQAQDTDGDSLENSANVDITIVDGQNPSFGLDSGVIINETDDKTQVIHGQIPLDVGSDSIASIVFEPEQPTLDGLTSNGEPTTVDISGNTITVFDNCGEPVLTVTIAADGSYEVKVTGPLDQGEGDSIDLDLSVTATDSDGDSTSGNAIISITDGQDATGGEDIALTITEGDLDTNGAATGNPSSYPVSQSGSFVIAAGEDRLVPDSVQVDPAQTAALLQELSAELTSGGQALTFTLDSNGNIIGTLPDGTVAITVSLSAVQDGQDVKVTVDIEQNVPLDHTNSGDSDGFVHSQGDNIEISVPVQAQDTDGDSLENSANVDITIVDGQNPSFGLDSGVIINETDDKTQVIHGQIPLDVGSDSIASIVFEPEQPTLDGLTSNGEPTTVDISGNTITVFDNCGEPVLTVTIATDGSYEVTVTGPLDQGEGDSIDLDLSVTATDSDGDSTSGNAIISITDGQNATGGEDIALTITEGDLDTNGAATGNPSSYPVSQSGSFVIAAGEDRLVPDSVQVDPAQTAALLQELSAELTSGGQALTFTLDSNGNIIGTLPDGTVAITVSLSAVQDGQDVKVTVDIEQNVPLDHTNSGDSDGFVHSQGDNIEISVPVQAQDTDGDSLENSANVDITIVDGQNPSLGADSTVSLEEGHDGMATGNGHIDVDTGSDEITSVHFTDNQPSLDGLTSNGYPTTYTISGDGHTIIVTLAGDPSVVVMEVSIDNDGNYVVNQHEPIDQKDDSVNDNENIILDVVAEDNDGDVSAPGQITINVNDGDNALGGQSGTISIVEGDLTPSEGQAGYPVSGTTSISVEAGVDRLDPTTVTIDKSILNQLINELETELTSNGQAIIFTYDQASGQLIGISGGETVLTIDVDAVQSANGQDIDISITITQERPLDHHGDDSNGLVTSSGDQININVPVQIQDTDGDELDNAISVDVSITDGDNPILISADAVTVAESALDGNGNHQGSDPDSRDEVAKGQINVDSGSDHIQKFEIDIDSFNKNYQGILTSGGEQIVLSYDSATDTYIGKADGKNIFTITIDENGNYTFELKGAIDHKEGTDSDDSLTINIPVQAVDSDGDMSNTVNIPVTIEDDEPSVTDVTLSMEEGETSPESDVLSTIGEGADDAQVTALIVDGERIELDSLPTSGEYHIYELKDGEILLGKVYISADGKVYFEAEADLDHDQEEIIKNIGVEVTDSDGDTAIGNITIEISDEDTHLSLENSSSFEDNGQHNDANVASDYDGIDINMSIDMGDQDRGEHIGQVTISTTGSMHGSFFFNGVELPIVDGKVTIPPEAFKDNGDGTFSLDGVTFKPDSDFSTIDGDLNFDVSAVVVNSDGSKHPEMNGSFTVTVEGVADIPTWDDGNLVYHYSVDEDSDNVQLDLQAVLNDVDGSENLFYIITITEGQGTLVGHGLVEIAPGVYRVAASDIDSIQVDPADNFSGDIKLDVYAQSEEKDNHDTADSDHKEIIINVNPDADNGVLKVSRVEADEDQRIDLASHIHLTSNDDFDGSEHLYIRISNLPDGAVLYLDGVALTIGTDGYYEIDYDNIGSLQLQPPLDSNEDFTFTVEGVVKDTTTITDEHGNSQIVEDINIVGTGEIDVALTGVVDEPELRPTIPDGWTPLPDNAGLETTIKEDAEGGVKLDFDVVSGEHVIDSASGATDGSETLSMVISGIPEGVVIKGPDGVPYALVYAGEDEHGNPIYQVDLDSLSGISVIPPLNSTEDIHLDVKIVVTENDGASQSFDQDVVIHIEPVVDATNYHNQSEGFEDEFVTINWQPNLTDGKEHATSLTILDLPADFDLYIDGQFIAHGGSSITLTPEQFALINQGKPLQVKGPEDSDTDLILHTEVTVTENDVDSSASDSKVVEGTIDVNIISKVEDDGHLAVLGSAEDGSIIELDSLASSDKGVIDLSKGSGQGISFVEDDNSSHEIVTKLVITFPDGLPDGFVVIGGINNGDGSWTIPQSALDDIKIIAPDGYNGKFDIIISAEVQDQGDNGEGDESSTVIKEDTIELDFSNNNSSSEEEAGKIEINQDYVITGDEDHHIDLGSQLENVVSVSTADGQHKFDEFTLVISAAGLPAGSVITGMEFDFETGEYVLKVPVNSDGSLDLSGIGLILPPDFAGDIDLDIRYVTTDTESGDVNTVDDQVTIEVNPIVDIPSNPQSGDHTPVIDISVVKTEGLDGDKQPLNPGETEHQFDGIAYEDGDITLDLSVALADGDTSTQEGLETVTSVTISVDPSMGFFVDASGNLVSSLTLTPDQLDSIQFRPAPDFSGEVTVNIKVDITDTADFDHSGSTATDSGSYETNASFDVVAVNDEVIWEGTENVIVGNEDSSISLAGIGGSIEDIDGSEQILSIKLTNVPDGFIIDGAVNNGNGVWTISIPPGQTSFDLDSLSIIPPKDFSGQVDIDIVVYSQEDSLDKPAENSTTVTIDVQPVADKVDSDIVDHVSGTEDDAIVIDLDLKAYDDTNTTDGSAGNVHENGPEGLQIIFTNVPDSSSFSLPPGVSGSCEKQPDGSWVINVDSSELDNIIFHPGDANNSNWDGQLNIEVKAVDNGEVADDSLAVNDVINMDIDPVNDAPIIDAPDRLETDEDTKLVISSLQVTDVDANETADGKITININVEHGSLSIPSGADLSGLDIQQDSAGHLVITGNIDDINDLLSNGIEYQPEPDFNGEDSMSVTVDDLGNSGAGGALTDAGQVDIVVNPVNDAPENTTPDQIEAQEDTTTVISGLSVSDPDYSESGSSDSMTVTLSVEHGILDITLPAGSSLIITGNGSGELVISGSLDEINKLLDQGVNYTADENYSGSDELTMTTNDGGNVGSGGEQSTTSKVPVTVTPKADAPSLSLSDSLPQMSEIRASSGTLIPLLGLIALAVDASETLSVELRNLGTGKIVDGHGNPIGQDMGNGVWILTPDQLADAHISGLSDGNNHIEIVAVSTESDGSTAESAPIDIDIVVDNLATSNGQIGGSAPSDEANLVIDSTAEATLIGGAGDDILVGGQSSDILLGGAGNDILWGGDLNGTGDHAKDIFKWERADLGHAGSAAADTIMDFEVGIDVIDLGDALDTSHLASMNDLLHLLQLSEQDGNAVLTLFDDDHNEIQSITLNGVSESDLLGQDPTGMTDEDKLENLLNSGNLQLSNNFGDEHSNTLTADSQGESLFGFDGDDVLVAGSGDDILTGAAGHDVFTWHENAINESNNPDIITDFTLDQDQIDLRDLLHDNDSGKSQMDDLLSHLDANINDEGKVDLTVTTDDGKEQNIVLDNVTAQDLDLSDSASSADIVNQLFSHDAFKIDPSNM